MTDRTILGQVVVLEFKQFGVHKDKSFPQLGCDEEMLPCSAEMPYDIE